MRNSIGPLFARAGFTAFLKAVLWAINLCIQTLIPRQAHAAELRQEAVVFALSPVDSASSDEVLYQSTADLSSVNQFALQTKNLGLVIEAEGKPEVKLIGFAEKTDLSDLVAIEANERTPVKWSVDRPSLIKRAFGHLKALVVIIKREPRRPIPSSIKVTVKDLEASSCSKH